MSASMEFQTVKDFAVGDRVSFTLAGKRVGTVSKIGRKYVYVTLDHVMVGGSARRLSAKGHSVMTVRPQQLTKE